MIEAVLQRVSRIPLFVRWRVHQPYLGQQLSRRRGTGLEFDQISESQPGEALRTINWAATARRGGSALLMNRYAEDKNLTIMLLVDLSASMDFGTASRYKRTLAAEVGASLVYSALMSHDRVGLLGFTSQVDVYLPPRQARGYLMAIPEAILQGSAGKTTANWAVATAALETWVKRPALVFLVSDFLGIDPEQLLRPLARLGQRHDVVAIQIVDTREVSLPAGNGTMAIRDLETGNVAVYAFSRKHQRLMAARAQARQAQLHRLCHELRMPYVQVTPHSDYCHDIGQLFVERQRRKTS